MSCKIQSNGKINFNMQPNRCYKLDKFLIGNKLKIHCYAYARREGKKQR